MKTALFIALFLAALPNALATRQTEPLKDSADFIRLDDEPCTSTAGKLSKLDPEIRKRSKAAVIRDGEKEYAGCWYKYSDSLDYLFDETGNEGLIPRALFKPVRFA